MKGNEVVMTVSAINNSVRGGMDLMVRDLLQVGSGLPSSHTVSIPNGAGSVQMRIPGPPGQAAFQTEAGDAGLAGGDAPERRRARPSTASRTDVLSILMADNAFLDQSR